MLPLFSKGKACCLVFSKGKACCLVFSKGKACCLVFSKEIIGHHRHLKFLKIQRHHVLEKSFRKSLKGIIKKSPTFPNINETVFHIYLYLIKKWYKRHFYWFCGVFAHYRALFCVSHKILNDEDYESQSVKLKSSTWYCLLLRWKFFELRFGSMHDCLAIVTSKLFPCS